MDENFQYIANALGPPDAQETHTRAELDYIRSRVPPALADYLEETGHAIFRCGQATLCRPSQFEPILHAVFKHDSDLSASDCTAISYTAFGKVYAWSQRHQLVYIEMNKGRVASEALAPMTARAPTLPVPPPKKPDPNVVACGTIPYEEDETEYFDWQGSPMLARGIAAHGALQLGECFAFDPPLHEVETEFRMVSRKRTVENLRRVNAAAHLTTLAQSNAFVLDRLGPSGFEVVRPIGEPTSGGAWRKFLAQLSGQGR